MAGLKDIFLLLCVGVVPMVVALFPQYVMFYPEASTCRGQSYEYSFNSINITQQQWINVASKFRGVWILQSASIGSFGSGDGSLCSIGPHDTYLYARKLIDTELEDSGIAFVNFSSSSTVVSSTENELSLPMPEQYSDICFTGVKNYTIFSGSNFTGNSTCLIPSSLSLSNGFGSQCVYPSIRGNIGSFRVGCSGRETNVVKVEDRNEGSILPFGSGSGTDAFSRVRGNTIISDGYVTQNFRRV